MTKGERIKQRRESLGISQVALADAIGEKKQTVYKYETDRITNIPIENIETSIQYPAFFIYDQDDYRWLYFNDLEEEYNRLLELKTTAENILLH